MKSPELIRPDGNQELMLEKMMGMESDAVNVAHGSAHTVKLPKNGPLALYIKA